MSELWRERNGNAAGSPAGLPALCAHQGAECGAVGTGAVLWRRWRAGFWRRRNASELGRKVPRRYQVPAPIRPRRTTENAIGRGGKIRAKRMRGFKRADAILPIMFLLSSLSGVLAGVPFRTLRDSNRTTQPQRHEVHKEGSSASGGTPPTDPSFKGGLMSRQKRTRTFFFVPLCLRGHVRCSNPLTYHHGVTVSPADLAPTRLLRPLPLSLTGYVSKGVTPRTGSASSLPQSGSA